MADIFSIFSLSTVLIGQALNIPVVSNIETVRQENKKVYHASMRQIVPYGKEPCQYSGVFVEYAQDWDDYDKNGELKSKAAPNKPIGYALLLNKEICPGTNPKAILRVGEKLFYPLFGKNYVIRELHQVNATDYMTSHESLRPKWLSQVFAKLKSESENNDIDAKKFLGELEKESDGKIKEEISKIIE